MTKETTDTVNRIRLSQGLSIAKLSEKCGWNEKHLYRYLSGKKRSKLSPTTLTKICKGLGVEWEVRIKEPIPKPSNKNICELATLKNISYGEAREMLETVLADFEEHAHKPVVSFSDLAGVLKEAIESEE